VIAIWANNSGDNPTCASADDAFPSSLGTTAKCKILASPSTGIDVPDCGNGVVEPGEQCDDGNTASGDGCSATCQIENIPTSCGNGVVDSGEQCDDGNNISGDGCSAACVAEFCGDGVTQVGLGETCDDGNTRSGDGCSANCTIEQPVPAVGGWGMAALTLLLAGAGYLALRRRTRTV